MIELLIVLVVAGILTSMSLGKINQIQAGLLVQKAVRQTQQQLQAAFVLAARQRQPIRISYSTTTLRISVQNRAQTVNLMPGIGFGNGSGLNLLSSEISFYPSTFVEVYPTGYASDTIGLKVSRSIGGKTFTNHLWMSKAGLVVAQ